MLNFVFRVSGNCKQIGTLLWYIEREVRLGNNQAFTSKLQNWHAPSKKQQTLHEPAMLNEMEAKKEILQGKNIKTVCRSKFDLRAKVDRKTNPVTDNGLDILANAIDVKCGIEQLLIKHNVRPNPDINDVSSCIEVTTTEHTETPKSICDSLDEFKHLNSNWKEYDHDFISFFKLDKSQAAYICEQTKKQSDWADWYKYRQDQFFMRLF